jgi:hypothetical protein
MDNEMDLLADTIRGNAECIIREMKAMQYGRYYSLRAAEVAVRVIEHCLKKIREKENKA